MMVLGLMMVVDLALLSDFAWVLQKADSLVALKAVESVDSTVEKRVGKRVGH